MKKTIIYLFTLLSSFPIYSQDCDCSSNMEWLINTFEKNDAGFQYVLKKKGKVIYKAHNKRYIEKASKISDLTECHTLLNDWTKFFRKKHIYIQNIKNEGAKNKAISNPPKEITQEQFDLYSSRLNDNHKGFEGVWKMGNYTIGIIKIEDEEKHIGFIIKADNNWKQKQIKLEIIKDKNNKYLVNYFMSDYSFEQINEVEIISQNFLRFGDIYLKRVEPVGLLNKTIDRYVTIYDAEKPFFLEISNKTLLLRIPSFDPSQKGLIDSIIKKYHNKIIDTENLIIDLRNNGGGAFKSVEKILPYIYTNPIKVYGYKYLSTPLNNKLWEGFVENLDNSSEFKNYAKKRLKKLNDNLGGFVESYANGISLKDSAYFTLYTIYENPKNIGIIINENCGSSTEEFLFYAKQSKKVKLFGTNTVGALDITDMQPVDFPTNDFRLYYCTAISMRLPELAIDDYGIQPDYYFDKSIKEYNWINRTIEILNYK